MSEYRSSRPRKPEYSRHGGSQEHPHRSAPSSNQHRHQHQHHHHHHHHHSAPSPLSSSSSRDRRRAEPSRSFQPPSSSSSALSSSSSSPHTQPLVSTSLLISGFPESVSELDIQRFLLDRHGAVSVEFVPKELASNPLASLSADAHSVIATFASYGAASFVRDQLHRKNFPDTSCELLAHHYYNTQPLSAPTQQPQPQPGQPSATTKHNNHHQQQQQQQATTHQPARQPVPPPVQHTGPFFQRPYYPSELPVPPPMFPPPTPAVLANISAALVHVPALYAGVIELMMGLNLPPPFLQVPSGLAADAATASSAASDPTALLRRHKRTKLDDPLLSSGESEIGSDGSDSDNDGGDGSMFRRRRKHTGRGKAGAAGPQPQELPPSVTPIVFPISGHVMRAISQQYAKRTRGAKDAAMSMPAPQSEAVPAVPAQETAPDQQQPHQQEASEQAKKKRKKRTRKPKKQPSGSPEPASQPPPPQPALPQDDTIDPKTAKNRKKRMKRKKRHLRKLEQSKSEGSASQPAAEKANTASPAAMDAHPPTNTGATFAAASQTKSASEPSPMVPDQACGPTLSSQPGKTQARHAPAVANPAQYAAIGAISLEELESGRLTKEAFLQLPNFVAAAYEPGAPTNRLFLRNVAKKSALEDLYYLFNRYRPLPGKALGAGQEQLAAGSEGAGIAVQLFTEGKMKGQAFVTLPSVDAAAEAMKETQGYVLHGKPLIVHFAKPH